MVPAYRPHYVGGGSSLFGKEEDIVGGVIVGNFFVLPLAKRQKSYPRGKSYPYTPPFSI
jgi:hypothetical protein